MKMLLGNTPVNSLNIHHFEMNTNDCTMVASDLQAGVTAVARGQKITGTGKSFEFAYYGQIETNFPQYIPHNINIVEISSVNNPVQLTVALSQMKNIDFTIEQIIGTVIVNGTEYDISIQAVDNILTLSCEQNISLQIFYGKDNYI